MEIMTSLLKRAFLYSWILTFFAGIVLLSPFIVGGSTDVLTTTIALILAGLGFTIPLYIFVMVLIIHTRWNNVK